MKIFFSIIGSKLKDLIFTDEFDQRYKNATTKLIFILYCCCGAFYFHNDVRTSFRKFWIIFNTVKDIFVISSCLFYLFNAPITDYFGFLIPAPATGGIWAKYCYILWIFFARNSFSEILEFFNDEDCESVQPEPTTANIRGNYASFFVEFLKKNEIKIIVLVCCYMVIGFTMQNLDNYANFDDYFITLYPMYIPCSKTFAVRAIFRMIQTITLLPEGISCVSLPIMLFIIIANMYDRFELLGLFLRHTSYSVFRSIDETYNLELAMDEGRIPSSLTKIDEMKIKKAPTLDKFLSNTTLVIKRHQRLYRIAKLYGEKMNFIVSIVYLLMNSMGVIFTFFVSSITETGYYHRTFLVIILVLSDIALCWLIFCIMGELFFNMNEIIAMEIYCSPWYHLEPKDRQVILTFLTIVQRPLTIVAFGIYPINLSIFPDMVNTIYSNSQKLRTLQQRKHSR